MIDCISYESQLIPDDEIGVCTGKCDDDEHCRSSCECYSVDLDWQPDMQDYATYECFVNVYTTIRDLYFAEFNVHNINYRISSALILLFTVVTSVTFAADIEFRKSAYFRVIWMTIFQMLIGWFGATAVNLYTFHFMFLLMFTSFIFLCLFPITMNIWLSKTFRRNHTCFVKKTRVLIPQQYDNFIQSDNKFGYKYQVISSLSSQNNNNDKMHKYWKFKTNKSCIINCVKNQNILHSKQAACTYFKTFILTTLFYVIVPFVLEAILLYVAGECCYFYLYFYGLVLIIQIFVQTIAGGILACVVKFLLQNDFRRVDICCFGIIVTYLFLSRVYYYGYWWPQILLLYYVFSNPSLYLHFTVILIVWLFVRLLPSIVFLMSVLYVMYVSPIARYTFGAMLVFGVFVGMNFSTLFPFEGYTHVLAGQIENGYGWRMFIMILWFLMLFILLSLVLYIKLHPRSKNKSSGLYQLTSTIGGIFSALLDYITDIIVIIFWFVSKQYFYAIFEILFILIAQIISALYINDIVEERLFSNSNSITSRTRHYESPVVRLLLGLGIGRIYFSVVPWNDDETLKSRYKMCKIWEMLFESMPSVGLSTYAILVNSINYDGTGYNTRNTSVLVSLLFSFINITNTVVSLLDTDRFQTEKKSNGNEIELASVILNGKNINDNCSTSDQIKSKRENKSNIKFNNTDIDVKDDLELQTSLSYIETVTKEENRIQAVHNISRKCDEENATNNDNTNADSNQNDNVEIITVKAPGITCPWIFDATTNEIRFFKEEKYVSKSKRNSDNQNCRRGCKKLLSSMFRFDVNKFKNFAIWIFLSSDLFVKMFSILFSIAFINNHNYDNINIMNSGNTYTNRLIMNGIFCFVFVCFVLLLEYFCFKCLVIQEKFTFIFALKYFAVCTFTLSFYFLLFVGLTYLPKMIEKQTFVKYQSFKICLSVFCVLIVFLLQVILEDQIVPMQFFILFGVVLLVHIVAFVYLTKEMFNAFQ